MGPGGLLQIAQVIRKEGGKTFNNLKDPLSWKLWLSWGTLITPTSARRATKEGINDDYFMQLWDRLTEKDVLQILLLINNEKLILQPMTIIGSSDCSVHKLNLST